MGTNIEDNKSQVQLKMHPPSLSSEEPSNKEEEASFLQEEAVDSIYARKCDLSMSHSYMFSLLSDTYRRL